jgi:hypothetical protein
MSDPSTTMTRKSLIGLCEEMRAVARGERRAPPLPEAQINTLSPESCNCGTVSSDYSDHGLQCPTYIAGKAARIARTSKTISECADKELEKRLEDAAWMYPEVTELIKRYNNKKIECDEISKKLENASLNSWYP